MPHAIRRLAALLLGLLLLYAAPRPAAGQWVAHTSLRSVTALAVSPEALWAGTTGGVFRYAVGSGDVRRFTLADGLAGTRAEAVAFDGGCGEAGCLWIGYSDGVLDRLDVARETVRSFRDVARAERFASRGINRLVARGDTLYVATDFGLVVFDAARGEVRDTYERFGSLPAATPVFDVLEAPGPDGAPALWVATAEGVAYAARATINLKDPAAWTAESAGLPAVEARALARHAGRLYVGTAGGLAVREPGGGYTALGLTARAVTDLVSDGTRLLGAERFGVVVVDDDGAGQRTSDDFSAPTAVAVGPSGRVWLGDAREGLVALAPFTSATDRLEAEQTFYPDGPYYNLFADLGVDAAGRLWVAGAPASPEAPDAGFYRRDADGTWTDYVAALVPALEGRTSFTRLFVDDEGAWFGSQSGGGLVFAAPGEEPVAYNRANSSLRGAESGGNPDYILVGGIGRDDQGNLWVSNRDAPRPLSVQTPDGDWTSLPLVSCDGITPFNATYDGLYVDDFGQLWLTVVDKRDLRNTVGLSIVDPGRDVTDPSDDVCRYFGSAGAGGQGLPRSREVRAVVEDRDGNVWIGTDRGLAYVLNTGIVAQDPNAIPVWPQGEDRSYLFQGLHVNDLAVDPANRVWIASNQGAWLVESVGGGYRVAEHFTTENSPLFSDVVSAVTVDGRTGDVYFATDLGLVSYRGDAVEAAPSSAELFVFPNPVRLAPDAPGEVFIDGLVDATTVLIVTPGGEVVRRFEARGGRARWDALDGEARPVPSGVYLVIAVAADGSETAYGKVAILR